MIRWILLFMSHTVVLAIGFALGIYFLPILIAPEGPDKTMLAETARASLFKGELTRDLKGSDFLHWGEGTISVSKSRIAHEGRLSPGPDYKLYLTKEFVEDEEQFFKARADAVRIGDVKTFNGFILDVPGDVDVEQYTTAVIWCERFSEFITATKYR
ncbi:MAG: DM13 domain-containing protein [Pseudomonadota bacterium]